MAMCERYPERNAKIRAMRSAGASLKFIAERFGMSPTSVWVVANKPPGRPAKLFVGARFGKWTVLSKDGYQKAVCRCDCGTKKTIYSSSLYNNQSGSCGCDQARNAWTTHGETRGGKWTKEYAAWNAMITRCETPSFIEYHRYGGRGIRVHPKWRKDFSAFLSHVGRAPSVAHSLDRIDNDGNYEPGNVRWATRHEQRTNASDSHVVLFRGERRPLCDLADEHGINRATAWWRHKQGWPLDRVLAQPKARDSAW